MEAEKADQTIGERLKALRKSKGYTLKDVEKKTKITAATLSNLENNLFKPSLAVLQKLGSLYNESIDYIVSGKLHTGSQISLEAYHGSYLDNNITPTDSTRFNSLLSDISIRNEMLEYYEKAMDLEKRLSGLLKKENDILKSILGKMLNTQKEKGSIVLDDTTYLKILSIVQ